MTEFHVDDNLQFAKQINKEEPFGGRLSTLFVNVRAKVYNAWVANGWLEHEGGFTYQYSTAGGGIEMVEVYALQFYQTHRHNLDVFMSENAMTFCNSVRVSLLMFGQDEAIYKQNLMDIMEWQASR